MVKEDASGARVGTPGGVMLISSADEGQGAGPAKGEAMDEWPRQFAKNKFG